MLLNCYLLPYSKLSFHGRGYGDRGVLCRTGVSSGDLGSAVLDSSSSCYALTINMMINLEQQTLRFAQILFALGLMVVIPN